MSNVESKVVTIGYTNRIQTLVRECIAHHAKECNSLPSPEHVAMFIREHGDKTIEELVKEGIIP
jgi:hypothetical protein